MKNNSKKFQNQRGISYTELLVILLIIGVISAIAIMQMGSSKSQFTRQNVARDLKVAFERARFDSVKRRAVNPGAPTVDTRAKVIIESTSFTLVTDANQNGDLINDDNVTFDTGDALVNNFGGQGIIIDGNGGITLPVTVAFNRRGEPVATNSSGIVNPIFLVCNTSCASPDNTNANIVLVTPTGTVNLLPGNATIPTFATPNVTPVPGTNDINPDTVTN